MLSIVIPSLNEEKYLPTLLASLKNQDFKDFEIILADAGSKDKTLDIAREHGCKIVPGGLPAKGRNEGAKVAMGEYILFLDADLTLKKDFLSRAMKAFLKDKRVGIAGFPIMPSDGKIIDKIFYGALNTFSFLTQKILPYTACAILVKKDVHQKIGGFDESIIFIEDYPYGKAAAKICKYKFMAGNVFYASARRFRKDGRFKVYAKYILAQIYMIFFGAIKTDIFRYKFDHYDKNQK